MKDTVSREVAIKLQKAGYKSECPLWYNKEGNIFEPLDPFKNQYAVVPAPTATQLAEELPDGYYFEKRDGGFICQSGNCEDEVPFTFGSTLPDALGLMREYLLVNKLI